MKDEAGFTMYFPDRNALRRRVEDDMMYDVIMQNGRMYVNCRFTCIDGGYLGIESSVPAELKGLYSSAGSLQVGERMLVWDRIHHFSVSSEGRRIYYSICTETSDFPHVEVHSLTSVEAGLVDTVLYGDLYEVIYDRPNLTLDTNSCRLYMTTNSRGCRHIHCNRFLLTGACYYCDLTQNRRLGMYKGYCERPILQEDYDVYRWRY